MTGKTYKKGDVVRFILTNQMHFGKIGQVGWKWYTVQYKKHGSWRSHRVLRDNSNTELAEV